MTPNEVVFVVRNLHQRHAHERRLPKVKICRSIPLQILLELLVHLRW